MSSPARRKLKAGGWTAVGCNEPLLRNGLR
jgi:hypothetical protein